MAENSARRHTEISTEGRRAALGAVSRPSPQGLEQRQEPRGCAHG